MFRIRVVQAQSGDCLILEYGSPEQPLYALIDGGPSGVYEAALNAELESIAQAGGELDAVVLTHVDNDHCIGLIDLLCDIRSRRDSSSPGVIDVNVLWHNNFRDVMPDADEIVNRTESLVGLWGPGVMSSANFVVEGISQGDALAREARLLSIPINDGFPDVITTATAPNDLDWDNLSIRIVGPTPEALEKLKTKWLEWAEEHEGHTPSEVAVAARADASVPNLSSIMMLVTDDLGKTALLTGDGRGDHLLEALESLGLTDNDGKIHVDVLKMPHHGSDRNVTRDFFRQITADTYVISANGRHDNPDLATFIWMVEAAADSGRAIKIVVTNRTESVDRLVSEYPPAEYGYELEVLDTFATSLTISLSD